MDTNTAERFSRIFKAVADPSRQKILMALRHDGELSVGVLADRLAVAQPTVSQHLRILREVEAVLSRKDGQQVFYRLCSIRLCDAMTDFVRIYHEEIEASKEKGSLNG